MQPTMIQTARSYTATGEVYTGGVITAATNASPIAITTTSPHSLVTGDAIQITSMTGNTAANGVWFITRTGASTFTLYADVLLSVLSVGNGTVGGSPVCHSAYPISSVINDWSLKLRVDALGLGLNAVVSFQDSVDGFINDIRTIATAGFTGANYQFSSTVSPRFTSTETCREWRKYDLMAARFGVASACMRVWIQEYDAGAGLVLSAWYEQ